MQSIAWSLLMLLFVVALIPASLWLLKRAQTLRPGGAVPRQMEVLGQLPLGPRERLLMVRVQDRVLVLGATAQQITLLAEADPASAQAATGAPAATQAVPGFAALMQSLHKNTALPKGRP